jgi:hypothetical protein
MTLLPKQEALDFIKRICQDEYKPDYREGDEKVIYNMLPHWLRESKMSLMETTHGWWEIVEEMSKIAARRRKDARRYG